VCAPQGVQSSGVKATCFTAVRHHILHGSRLGPKPATQSASTLPNEQYEPLKRVQHDRWLREVLQKGGTFRFKARVVPICPCLSAQSPRRC
jgi:hypothetical protein